MGPYSHIPDTRVHVSPYAIEIQCTEQQWKAPRQCCASDPASQQRTNRPTNRWRQLRRLVTTLTGSSTTRDEHSTRRRIRRDADHQRPRLLLHHDFWLEAIDPKHRYGFHLRAFFHVWKEEMATVSKTETDTDRRNCSFFYWLDYGRGAALELPECDRVTLNDMRVEYCSPQQRRQFEVHFTEGAKLTFAHSQELVHSDGLSKWIFVLSREDKLYVARKHKGRFHHSSFLAGEPVVAAGKIFSVNGQIQAIEPHSGHFKPRLCSLLELCHTMKAHGVDTDAVRFIKPKKWNDPWPFESNQDDDDTLTMELFEYAPGPDES